MLEKLMLWLRDGCRLVSHVWVVAALWMIATCLIITTLGHGCVACLNYGNEKSCYQEYHETQKFIVRKPKLGPDPIVSAGATAEDAWAQAKRVCGNKD